MLAACSGTQSTAVTTAAGETQVPPLESAETVAEAGGGTGSFNPDNLPCLPFSGRP